MFYNLHKDTSIGYKLLSDSDLGRGGSHQTHIGLLEGTLNFIPNYHQEASAQLIYNNEIIEVIDFLDPIRRPDNSIRSPKIRSGTKKELKKYKDGITSTVNAIRNISQKYPNNNWYLFWFALDDKELIFILIRENSISYNDVKLIFGNLTTRNTITKSNPSFSIAINYFTSKVNNLNILYLEQLELYTQTNENTKLSRIKPKRYDIEKAQKLFQAIGKKGEELVNHYLEKEKYNGEIQGFNWVNKDSESGFPFDFEITDNRGQLVYSDVKSTSYRFEQKIFFSSQELKFIQQNNNYLIHRVFDLNNYPKLRICDNIETLSHGFVKNLNVFNTNIENDGLKLNGMQISVNPDLPLLNFNTTIIL